MISDRIGSLVYGVYAGLMVLIWLMKQSVFWAEKSVRKFKLGYKYGNVKDESAKCQVPLEQQKTRISLQVG